MYPPLYYREKPVSDTENRKNAKIFLPGAIPIVHRRRNAAEDGCPGCRRCKSVSVRVGPCPPRFFLKKSLDNGDSRVILSVIMKRFANNIFLFWRWRGSARVTEVRA